MSLSVSGQLLSGTKRIENTMNAKQKYLFDLNGYLHLKSVLAETELCSAQEAIDRLLEMPSDKLPPGIVRGSGNGDTSFSNGFSADKSLESLTWHPSTRPIISELTGGKPRFGRGSLVVNQHHNEKITSLHCAREGQGWQTRRYAVKDGHIHCNDFICFFYFTDVNPDDGGIVVLPGSHKSEFERPKIFPHPKSLTEPDGIFFQNLEDLNHPLHPALVNVTPQAGDVVILSELTVHGVLIWKPTNRDRRFLILRYKTQYFSDDRGRKHPFPEEVWERLSPETQELSETVSYGHTKSIISPDLGQ